MGKKVSVKYNLLWYSSSPLVRSAMNHLTRGVVSLGGDNLVIFYHDLSASEIWPGERGRFWLKWHYL